jgi:uroporphyrin-III C-methyltransferase
MRQVKVLSSQTGKVYLVGAGPGDPELLTVKGVSCLQKAEVVIYDRLVDPRLLELAPARAERIFVGKKGNHYSFPQKEINRLLARKAQQGHQVVRLKGGDPFLFGRGGEEALYLVQQKIPFEVVPGVTAALAVPAVAGIPVTHRDLSSSVTIVAGQQAAEADPAVDWKQLGRAADTLIVLMPLGNLRYIVSQLILHGRRLDTPAALIESGTLESQRQITAPLGRIVAESERVAIESPAVLVIGDVVRLSESLTLDHPFTSQEKAPSIELQVKKSS